MGQAQGARPAEPRKRYSVAAPASAGHVCSLWPQVRQHPERLWFSRYQQQAEPELSSTHAALARDMPGMLLAFSCEKRAQSISGAAKDPRGSTASDLDAGPSAPWSGRTHSLLLLQDLSVCVYTQACALAQCVPVWCGHAPAFMWAVPWLTAHHAVEGCGWPGLPLPLPLSR